MARTCSNTRCSVWGDGSTLFCSPRTRSWCWNSRSAQRRSARSIVSRPRTTHSICSTSTAESRAHPVVPILVATQAMAPAVQWPLLWHGVTPVFARVRSHAGITAARHHGTHPRAGATARCSRLGRCAVPAGADDRRGGNHAVQSPRRRRHRRGARRCRQSRPDHDRHPTDHRCGPLRRAARGAVRHRHPRRRENPVWPERGVRRGDRCRVPDRQSAVGARDARSAGARCTRPGTQPPRRAPGDRECNPAVDRLPPRQSAACRTAARACRRVRRGAACMGCGIRPTQVRPCAKRGRAVSRHHASTS